jgi:predicted naringenin-chalcone synthase
MAWAIGSETFSESFSKTFSKGVEKGLAQVVTKYLQLRGKDRIFFIKKRA